MTEDLLVGSTGFVGQNLAAKHTFSRTVHSTDIDVAFGTKPDLAIYAGVPSAMYLANSNPEADLAIMAQARENLRKIEPHNVVLISTIAVFGTQKHQDERTLPSEEGLSAYGANRLQLEQWVREDFSSALIVRLPALYGTGLKKNFIYDLIHLTPSLLTDAKYRELSSDSRLVERSYDPAPNGFWKVSPRADAKALRKYFERNDFNALSFTDSRSRFQFYDLANLWSDLEEALDAGWDTLNLATPPLSAGEVYRYLHGKEWTNELASSPFDYDMRTIHTPTRLSETGYRCSTAEELESIHQFVKEEQCRLLS